MARGANIVTYAAAAVIGFGGAASIAMLNDGDDERAKSIRRAAVDLTDSRAASQKSPLMSELERQYLEIERQLGAPPNIDQRATPEDALKMIDELPSRFEEVANKLAEAERHDGDHAHAATPSPSSPKTVEWRRLSTTETLELANNANAEFTAVNRALGIAEPTRSTDTVFSDAHQLLELTVTDISKLDRTTKRRLATKAVARAAGVLTSLAPLKDINDLTLFAVEPAETLLTARYRLNDETDSADADAISKKLQRRACAQRETDLIMRLGGGYVYVVYEADGDVANRISVTSTTC